MDEIDKQMIANLFECIYEENIEFLDTYDFNNTNIWDMKMTDELMEKYDYRTNKISVTPLGFAIYCYATEYDRPGLLKTIEYIIKNTSFTVDLQNELNRTMLQEISGYIDDIHNYCLQYSECFKDEMENDKPVYITRGKQHELDERTKHYTIFMEQHKQKIINLRYIKKLLKQKKEIPQPLFIEIAANLKKNIFDAVNSIFTPAYRREEYNVNV